MSLTKKQFDILSTLATAGKKLSQRQLEEKCSHSLGTINNVMKELTVLKYVSDGAITRSGLNALEPYKAKRAIFLAAGDGTRLIPLTLNTPKPLVRVNGTRMLDGLIDAVLSIGITEIYVVRGYLSEQFDQLLYKYPMIKFLENPLYNESNNISSAMVARYLLSNAFVFESDLIINNPSIIKKYHYNSEVFGVWTNRTDDWSIDVDKKRSVIKEQVGGINCYRMIGIYYINTKDGAMLAEDIEEAFMSPGGKERYWETVPNEVFKGKYTIEVIPIEENDVIEIDTLRELKAVDKTYDI